MKKILISVLIFMAIILAVNVANAINLESFKNDNVLCIELAQDFGGKYTKQEEPIIWKNEEKLAEFQSGLGHILAYNCDCSRTVKYGQYIKNSEGKWIWSYKGDMISNANCHKQLALWAYLNQYYEEASEFFGNIKDLTNKSYRLKIGKLETGEGYIQRGDIELGVELKRWDDGYYIDTLGSTNAYTLYKDAINKRLQRDKYEFDIDLYTNKDRSKRNSSKYSKKS